MRFSLFDGRSYRTALFTPVTSLADLVRDRPCAGLYVHHAHVRIDQLAHLTQAYVDGAYFAYADLSGAYLSGGDLSGALTVTADGSERETIREES